MQNKIIPAIIIAALVISSCNNNETKELKMTDTTYKWPDSIAAPIAEK